MDVKLLVMHSIDKINDENLLWIVFTFIQELMKGLENGNN